MYASLFLSSHVRGLQPAYTCLVLVYVDIGLRAHVSSQEPYFLTLVSFVSYPNANLTPSFHPFVDFAPIFK